MLDTEDAARSLLASAVSDQPPGIDLMRGVHKLQAARRTRLRTGFATAAAAVIAAGTAVGLTVSAAPSALAAVTAAASRTMAQSYRVLGTTWIGEPGLGTARLQYSGILNPSRGIGEVNGRFFQPGQPINSIREIYVGGYLYARFLGPESRVPGANPMYRLFIKTPASMGPPLIGACIADCQKPLPGGFAPAAPLPVLFQPGGPRERSTSPTDLLAVLRSAGEVREIGPASGPGWSGTRYAFRATSAGVSGTVDVDRQGRVRAIEAIAIWPWPGGPLRTAVAYSDFGVRVSVTAPPASEIYTPPPLHLVKPSRQPGRSSSR